MTQRKMLNQDKQGHLSTPRFLDRFPGNFSYCLGAVRRIRTSLGPDHHAGRQPAQRPRHWASAAVRLALQERKGTAFGDLSMLRNRPAALGARPQLTFCTPFSQRLDCCAQP